MGTSIGYKSIMGVVGQADFQTETQVVKTEPVDKVLLQSESINTEYVNVLHDYLVNSAGYLGSERVFDPVAGSIEVDVPYTEKDGSNADFVSADLLIASAMGLATWVSSANQLTMVDDLAVWLTIAWSKSVDTDAWCALGCMINSMTLSCNEQDNMKASFDIVAGDILYPNDGATTEAMLAELCDDLPNLVMFDDFVIRVADQSDALQASDQIQVSNFSITLNNNLTAAQQTTAASSGHTAIKEPIQYRRNGFREVTLEITMPRYEADTLFDFWANDTKLQADFMGTGPGGAAAFAFDILFPHLRITNISAPIAGPGVVSQTVTFQALVWNAANTYLKFSDSGAVAGAPEANSEMWIELDNDRTAVVDMDG